MRAAVVAAVIDAAEVTDERAGAIADAALQAVADNVSWLIPLGYQPDGVGACRSCHQIVLWTHTQRGNKAPLNQDGTSHFSTCPQADGWRKPTAAETMRAMYPVEQ